MRYVKDTPLEVGYRIFQLRPPVPSITVIVKGTFDPVEGGPARFADEQVPTTGEAFFEDDAQRSQRVPSDFALLKPKGECFVIGRAWAPPNREERMLACSFRVGPIAKSFVVVGDRQWPSGASERMSDAVPFRSMELSLERAYGGPGFAPNPYGRGREPIETDEGRVLALPNIEDPRALISSKSSKPAPVVIGPHPPTWPSRQRLTGTYDDAYMSTRWPWLPSDFDFHYFLEAPSDQQLASGSWRGDEPVEASYLHPSLPAYHTRLPGIAPRVLLELRGSERERIFREVRLVLDTVTLDGELGKIVLVWRGSLEIPSDDPDRIPHLFVAHEPLGAPAQPEQALRLRMEALLATEAKEEADAEGTPPAPEGEATTDEQALGAAGAAPSGAEESGADAETDSSMADLDARLAAMGAQADDGAELPPAPSAEELRARVERSGTPMTPELEQMLADLREPEAPPAPPPPAREAAPPPLEGRALVLAKLEAREPLAELDLTGADLTGLDLSGQDFTRSILSEVDFERATLRGARFRDATLRNAKLSGVELGGADLSGADLSGAHLIGASLAQADLSDADLTGAHLPLAQLPSVKASRAVFTRADLTEAVLAGGEFEEADFERAKLDRADLRRATLRNAMLEDASATGANFMHAVMTKSRGAGLSAAGAQLGAIDAEDSFWERADLSRADFGFAKLARADFSDAVLIGAALDGASLEKARFDRANAHGMRARKANLMQANFESATLSYADLRGASLFGAELWRAKVDHAQLELADVARTLLEPR